MKKNFSEEKLALVERELKQGKMHEEIASMLGMHISYVGIIKKILIQEGRITEEQIKQAKFERQKKFLLKDDYTQKLIKYIKAGLSQEDIAQLLNTYQTSIGRAISKLKEYGLITQEEIDNARQQYKEEVKYDNFRRDQVLEQLKQGRIINDFAEELGLTHRGARIIQDSLIEEGRITQAEIDEAVATKGKETQKRRKVIELLTQGYTYREVTAEVGCCEQTVKKMKEEAIKGGEFTEEEYQRERKERQERLKSEPKKPKEENKQLEQQVLELLRNGKNMFFMRKKTGASKANIQAIIKQLIKEGKITQTEIDEARDKNAKETERKILIGLRRGYTQKEISEMFEEGEYSITTIRERIDILKQRGKITDEEIQRYRYETEQGDKETFEFVIRGMEQGLSITEMAESDENGYFTESKIKNTIKRMKKNGMLTAKDIEKWQKVRKHSKQKQSKKDRKKKDREIIEFLLQGLTAKEIGEKLGFLENTIHANIARIIKEGKITQDRIDKAREVRKQEHEEQQKQQDEIDIQNYKNSLKLALKISKTEVEYTDQQINKLVRKLVWLANKMQLKGLLKREELKIISESLFQAGKVDINNVIGIAKLYLKMKNYQASIYTLNYSRDYLSEEDLQRIDEAIKTVARYKKKIEASQMIDQEYSIEVIHQITQLSLADIIELKNKKIKNNQKKWQDPQGDDEYTDL